MSSITAGLSDNFTMILGFIPVVFFMHSYAMSLIQESAIVCSVLVGRLFQFGVLTPKYKEKEVLKQ